MKIGIIGRTNVGKSTLFNALIGNHRAIVTDISWTTRELLVDKAKLGNKEFTVIDSPWLDTFKEEVPFLQSIIDDADMLLFVVDSKEDIRDNDREIVEYIQKANMLKKTILVINKLDGKVYSDEVYTLISEWYQFGFSQIVPTSTLQKEWIEFVRDALISLSSDLGKKHADSNESRSQEQAEAQQQEIPLAIVGKPNAWKSTLINTLSWERVAHVEEKAWTTLDYISTSITYQWDAYIVYDTAWIKRKWKTQWLEKIAYRKTQSLLGYKKPVVVFVIDLLEGVTKRDLSLLSEIEDLGLPVVIAFNKIDLLDKHEVGRRIKQIKTRFTYLQDYYHVSISWKDAIHLPVLMDHIKKIYAKRSRRIGTSELNTILTKSWILSPPRFPKNKVCKWKYITQVDVSPPRFMISVNNKQYVNFSFVKWVKNVLRTHAWFYGVPVELEFSSKKETNPFLNQS